MSILQPDQSYTFSQIGKLVVTTDDLLAEYGYGFSREQIDLPQWQGALPPVATTQQRIQMSSIQFIAVPLLYNLWCLIVGLQVRI